MSNSMDAGSEQELAWAAGIFDGEGSSSTYLTKPNKIPRRQMAVSQGGLPGHTPAVLLRFKEIVRVGSITGPYDGLYYWKITTKGDVDAVGALLWQYLSREKRQQFAAAATRMQRPVPGPLDDSAGRDSEAAWAAGLFDGEGTFGAYAKPHMPSSWRGAQMSVPQASATNVPGDAAPLSRCRRCRQCDRSAHGPESVVALASIPLGGERQTCVHCRYQGDLAMAGSGQAGRDPRSHPASRC